MPSPAMKSPLLLINPFSDATSYTSRFIRKVVLAASLAAALLSSVARAVTVGDEQYGNLNGYFYLPTTAGNVVVIDPVKQSIVKTIPIDAAPVLPVGWGDCVYVRDQAQLKHYAFLADSGLDRMIVIDTDTQSVVTKVRVGDNPVHIYALPSRDEVWAHLDSATTLDVFPLSEVRYRASSGSKGASAVPGHGKLLVDPNLEDDVFVTNVKEGVLYRMNVRTRQLTATLNITDAATSSGVVTGYSCLGTHGIAFSDVNNRIYVECTNPTACANSDVGKSACTGSIWGVDASSLSVTARLTSPFLSALLGIAGFGILGQPYRTPEEQFIVVPNKLFSVLHVLQPTATATKVLEIPMGDRKPGSVKFWPKDSSATFGADPNPGNYWLVVALENADASSGLAFLDMDLVVKAFAASTAQLPESSLTYLAVGPGTQYRPLGRGGDFAMTPVYPDNAPPFTAATKVALVNIKSKTVLKVFDVAGVARVLFVPIHTDEIKYELDLQSNDIARLDDRGNENNTAASGALGLAIVSFLLNIAIIAYLLFTCVTAKGKTASSNGYNGSSAV